MQRVIFVTFLSLVLSASLAVAGPIGFQITTIATNATDPDLVNPWGMSSSPGSPIWISSNGTGKAEIYNTAGVKQGLVVSIPGDGTPTGTVFSNIAGMFNSDAFLFASEDGTVSGWRGLLGATAETLQPADAANVYKGIALGVVGSDAYAYLANFRSGSIDVLKGTAGAPNLAGSFIDGTLPSGYAPFDIQNLGGSLYVTYALQNPARHDDVPGAGNGFVDKFDLSGNLIAHLVSHGPLNSPWGLAIAPAGFGDVAGDLLVGNFGDGAINAFDSVSGAFQETLVDPLGATLSIDGLWGLRVGNGGSGGNAGSVYFTAGPNGEAGGQFGRLDPTPEPSTWALGAFGILAGLGLRIRKSRQQRA